MKNLFKVLVVCCLAVCLLIGCGEKKENNVSSSNTNSSSSKASEDKNVFSADTFNAQFVGLTGEDRRGEIEVKKLIQNVINSNKANPDHLISVSLSAYKGNRSLTNDESKLIIIHSCIGPNSSIYNVKVEKDENGVINKIDIVQTEGTATDPDIPEEVSPTDYDNYDFLDYIEDEEEVAPVEAEEVEEPVEPAEPASEPATASEVE